MKTILKIIAILLVAGIVAGAFSLAVDGGSTTSSGTAPAVAPSTGTDASGQNYQLMERPEGGDRDGGSLAGGLAGILGTLAKLTGISIVVLLLQKGAGLLGSSKLKLAQR